MPALLAWGGSGMDLRAYYQKVRSIEAELRDSSVVIVSRATPDGGRRGVKTQVPRSVAARMIADGKADLATAEEAEAFRSSTEAKWKRI